MATPHPQLVTALILASAVTTTDPGQTFNITNDGNVDLFLLGDTPVTVTTEEGMVFTPSLNLF